MARRRRDNRTAFFFILPWLIGFICFTCFPVGFMVRTSLTNRKLNGLSQDIGLANYRNMLKSSTFLNSLKVTVMFTIIMVIVTTIWAIIMALLLNRKQRMNSIFQFCYFLPSVIPSVALAYAFRTIFGKDAGLLNGLLSFLRGSRSRSTGFMTNIRSIWSCSSSHCLPTTRDR